MVDAFKSSFMNFRFTCLGSSLLLTAVALTGCGTQKNNAGGPPPGAPVEVGVVTIQPQRVELSTELPGRTSPYRIADVRPQVNGIILKRMFEEGAEVQAGQQLYQIDPAPYQAAYDSAMATLARAQASLLTAKAQADRYSSLVGSHVVSKQDNDNAIATEQEAEADVASGKAAVETAQINLNYTKMVSPITGRTGRSNVTEGALVTTNQTTALVTIQQLDPIYVDFTQSSALLLRLKRELANGQLKSAGTDQAEVGLILEDDSAYAQKGRLQFAEVTVGASTGSVTLRAVFPNPQKILLPGMFVRGQLQEGVNEQALLVPQQGVTHNQKGDPTALVVGDGNKVELRLLKTDRTIGDKWLVTGGIKAGDKVIIEGLQKVAPGAAVKPTEVTLDPSQSPSP